jgi:stage IV sporulation protein FB
MMIFSVFTGYFIELLTLFAIVLIHELGHVVAAKSFGWRVMEVQLLPFGGVAVVEESGNVPAHEELWVALAGPLQNAWMAAFAYGMKQLGWNDPVWWEYFMQANLWIGLFNLLPVLPLDGGKALVSLLSYQLSYHKVLRFCTGLSLLLSFMIVCFAVIPLRAHGGIQLNLLVIGFFLMYANGYGFRHIPYQFRRFLTSRESRALQHMAQGSLAQPIVVAGQKEISAIVHLFMREKYHLIFILNEQGMIQKVLTEQRIIRAYFSEQKSNRAVSELFM